MTDIRVVKTWRLWGQDGRGSMTCWIRQPISNISQYEPPLDDERMLVVRTSDGQEVRCDDTPDNRKALGMVEAGIPPSILLRHEYVEALRVQALRDSDEASR